MPKAIALLANEVQVKFDPPPSAAFAQLIRRDQDMWIRLIRERNIKVEF